MRPVSTSALLALTLVLGGCGGTLNRGLESVHQPVVSRADYAIDLAAGSGGLDAGETQRLAAWFNSLGLGYGDRVAVDDPSGYNRAARQDVAGVAGRYGLLVAEGAPVTAGSVAPGNVRVVVTRTSASVPGCPDWSRPAQPEYDASSMSNYGCAVNSNLAAMIANPEDLVHGQEPGSASDARTSAKAIQTYRDKQPTGAGALKNETTGGK